MRKVVCTGKSYGIHKPDIDTKQDGGSVTLFIYDLRTLSLTHTAQRMMLK
jgi:hypothetical protein